MEFNTNQKRANEEDGVGWGFKEEGVLREYYRDETGHFIDAWAYGMLESDFRNQEAESKLDRQVDTDELVCFIGEILRWDSLDRASKMADVPTWDSLSHVTLMVALEEEFKIKLRPYQIAECTSVEAINNIICSK